MVSADSFTSACGDRAQQGVISGVKIQVLSSLSYGRSFLYVANQNTEIILLWNEHLLFMRTFCGSMYCVH